VIWWNSKTETGPGTSYLEGLRGGNADELLALFSNTPEIYDPWHGRVKGESAFRAFVERAATWLSENGKSIENRQTVDTGDYISEESTLEYDFDGKTQELLVAVTADRNDDGTYDELRVYYRTVEIDPLRSIRQPLLQGSADAHPPKGSTLDKYLIALAGTDVDAVLDVFESDGSFSGGDFYPDPQALRDRLYPRMFELGEKGAVLEHCKLHDDGTTYVLEFNAFTRGPLTNHPQAGVAIYERGGTGLIKSARVYDDVQDPRPGDRWA
jgi:SnoaL-like domain